MLYRKSLTEEDCNQIWLRDKADMEQVQNAVNVAKTAYEARPQQSGVRKWLTKFSEHVV